MTQIEQFLKKNGPTLTSDLIENLSEVGVNRDAIRKRLSRLRYPIIKLDGFFLDNQTLFFLQEQFETPEYYEGLVNAFKTSAKRYFSIIKAIEFHHGYIHENQLASYTFSPIINLRGHKNISNIINDLIKLHLLIIEDENYRIINYSSIDSNNNFRYHKGVELAKNIILQQFYDWSRNIGLISYNSGRFHSEFSKFQWAFVAPSYVSGILKKNKNKGINPCFVIVDVLIGRTIGLTEISFFLKKIEIIKTQNISNFLPFLIVDRHISEDAFTELKQKGIIIGFVDKLFGSDYEELLKSLIGTVTNAGAILMDNPQAYVKFTEQLDKLVDGKTNNLRGDLFELAVGYYHSNLCQSLEIGKRIYFEGEFKEIDVYASRQNELIIAECKGYKYKINAKVAEEWLTNKIPIIYNWAKGNISNDKNVIFEIWSTGGFTDDALELLKEKPVNTKKYKIEFFQKEDIIKKAQTSKSQKIVEIMRAYFTGDD